MKGIGIDMLSPGWFKLGINKANEFMRFPEH